VKRKGEGGNGPSGISRKKKQKKGKVLESGGGLGGGKEKSGGVARSKEGSGGPTNQVEQVSDKKKTSLLQDWGQKKNLKKKGAKSRTSRGYNEGGKKKEMEKQSGKGKGEIT